MRGGTEADDIGAKGARNSFRSPILISFSFIQPPETGFAGLRPPPGNSARKPRHDPSLNSTSEVASSSASTIAPGDAQRDLGALVGYSRARHRFDLPPALVRKSALERRVARLESLNERFLVGVEIAAAFRRLFHRCIHSPSNRLAGARSAMTGSAMTAAMESRIGPPPSSACGRRRSAQRPCRRILPFEPPSQNPVGYNARNLYAVNARSRRFATKRTRALAARRGQGSPETTREAGLALTTSTGQAERFAEIFGPDVTPKPSVRRRGLG